MNRPICLSPMRYEPDKHRRRSVRMPGYDYSQAGAYFVTICVEGKRCLLGHIEDGKMILNAHGHTVSECWQWLSEQYPYVYLEHWVVMPNHLRGIVVISDKGRTPNRPIFVRRHNE